MMTASSNAIEISRYHSSTAADYTSMNFKCVILEWYHDEQRSKVRCGVRCQVKFTNCVIFAIHDDYCMGCTTPDISVDPTEQVSLATQSRLYVSGEYFAVFLFLSVPIVFWFAQHEVNCLDTFVGTALDVVSCVKIPNEAVGYNEFFHLF